MAWEHGDHSGLGTPEPASPDTWQFLEDIEAPMWVDLTEEAALAGQERDDPWFHFSHRHHELPLDELSDPSQGLDSHPSTSVTALPSTSSWQGPTSWRVDSSIRALVDCPRLRSRAQRVQLALHASNEEAGRALEHQPLDVEGCDIARRPRSPELESLAVPSQRLPCKPQDYLSSHTREGEGASTVPSLSVSSEDVGPCQVTTVGAVCQQQFEILTTQEGEASSGSCALKEELKKEPAGNLLDGGELLQVVTGAHSQTSLRPTLRKRPSLGSALRVKPPDPSQGERRTSEEYPADDEARRVDADNLHWSSGHDEQGSEQGAPHEQAVEDLLKHTKKSSKLRRSSSTETRLLNSASGVEGEAADKLPEVDSSEPLSGFLAKLVSQADAVKKGPAMQAPRSAKLAESRTGLSSRGIRLLHKAAEEGTSPQRPRGRRSFTGAGQDTATRPASAQKVRGPAMQMADRASGLVIAERSTGSRPSSNLKSRAGAQVQADMAAQRSVSRPRSISANRGRSPGPAKGEAKSLALEKARMAERVAKAKTVCSEVAVCAAPQKARPLSCGKVPKQKPATPAKPSRPGLASLDNAAEGRVRPRPKAAFQAAGLENAAPSKTLTKGTPVCKPKQSAPAAADDLTALLAEHNRKFRPAPTYVPRMHSTKDVKEWEEISGRTYYELDPRARELANEEIKNMKKSRC